MSKIIYLIAGTRTFENYELMKKVLDGFEKPDLIVSGGAKGADLLGEKYANDNNIPIQQFLANWKSHGKKAGYLRNKDMVDFLVSQKDSKSKVFVFWDGRSKGSKHTIDLARSNKLDLEVIFY